MTAMLGLVTPTHRGYTGAARGVGRTGAHMEIDQSHLSSHMDMAL
jgi:hypothetical protein